MKRNLKIFGKSVPMWGVIGALLLTAGVGYAAFASLKTASVSITAASGPTVTLVQGWDCSLVGIGTIDTCDTNPDGSANVAVRGVDNDTQVLLKSSWKNEVTGDPVTLQMSLYVPETLPAGVSSVDFSDEGNLIYVGDTGPYSTITVGLADLQADQVIDPFNVGIEFLPQ